ncbi:hypothetical protein GCM10008959_32980 [Deinococcus seoulensis]|uniref:Uncharacterized protein n=1 Tax=Deinococcus seoulensis TaxID=1837379 RepID=A0ABQ2RYC7_9DEIO|nr:hypothetical protein [Deinococcus seoulensis]GGR68292.1 hypothetical protein GCM10008959_32980 [Deinococcus seoulensis]
MGLALRDWDPWRDARAEDWRAARLARPRTPPTTPLPPDRAPPSPPLGVAVVDAVPGASRDEPLPRARAPWLRPTLVERWNAQAQTWEASPAALAILARRSAFSPAGWPDEIDDRRKVPGRLRVTYPAGPPLLDQPMTRVLTARGTLPTQPWLIDDQPADLWPLGPYARPNTVGRYPRGVYPLAVITPLVTAPNQPLTFTLDLRGGQLMQLLLALTGVPS